MRLIDADALMEKVCGNCQGHDCRPDATDTVYGCMFADAIDDAPTVESEPVRNGKLIEGRYPDDYKCSACGQAFRDDIVWIYDIEEKGHQKFPPEYCPECGAKWSGCEFIDELEQKGSAKMDGDTP